MRCGLWDIAVTSLHSGSWAAGALKNTAAQLGHQQGCDGSMRGDSGGRGGGYCSGTKIDTKRHVRYSLAG